MDRPTTTVTRRAAIGAALGLALLAGCGDGEEEERKLFPKAIKIEDIPPMVMDVAKKSLPDVTFSEAWTNHLEGQEAIQSYEIRGRVPTTGKIREIRVGTNGTILERE